MWTAISGILAGLFSAVKPVLNYLKLNKVLKKDKTDKIERKEDMEHVDKIVEEIKEVVKDGDVDDINNKLGWKK